LSGSAGSEAPSLPYAMRFLFEAGSAPLMGCLWPSSDSGGLRPFPFSLFLERKRKVMLADLESGLGHTASVWRRLDAAHAAHAGAPDGQSYLEAMRKQTLLLDDIEPERAPSIDFDDWISALFGAEGRDGLDRLFGGLRRLVPSTPRGPLRLPLVTNLPATPQVVAWWRVAVELGLLPSGQLATVFFPHELMRGEEPAYALYFPRTIQPVEVHWLSSSRRSSARGPGDFASGRAPALASSAASPESSAPLTDSLRGALVSFRARSGG
jgi:hypothetical protein